MKQLVNVYKPIGLTPYQTIQKLREKMPEYKEETIGFAGRLDPLAHGVLLLMVGDATKEREKYLDLPKEYEFEALFGLQTDTYDVLGLLQDTITKPLPPTPSHSIQTFLTSKLGKHTQKYPPYSSKAVQGKPLFWWAKNNRLSEISIPTREIEIYQFALLSMEMITAKELQTQIEKNINEVEGHFRQEETLQKWKDFFQKNKRNIFQTAKFRIQCSSGTYVRGLVQELGEKLGCGALTVEILRTKVGSYMLKNASKIML